MVTLAVGEFGQNSQSFSLGKKVHSARGLHARGGGDVAKLSKSSKGIEGI
jgi:hypothetical protein